ncbi:oplophorus-luciferin 2-monooxygenase non-catalytic subunit-like [Penaeus japonicus]|uniref:oplophorus-luciferin 2-monooxygenase non-catalytic subunit-like n=1 Tax=Penaeus japonicus TaxID=27405 RepID=UPI001C710121|nr:oplophorus-luciferin 2-monooxygenase non-catalytic subunit-like [Penaeus japonicus]
MCFVYSFTVFLLLVGVACCDTTINSSTSVTDAAVPYKSPCPEAEDIRPCTCFVRDDLWVDLICRSINEEEELGRIFSATFPDPELNVIRVGQDSRLRVLQKDVFEGVTFRALVMREGVLEEVMAEGLRGGLSTALSLDFTSNRIASFPFDALQDFVSLTELLLGNNSISSFPSMQSSTLQVLSLANNPLRSLPSWAFTHLPALVSLDLDHTGLTALHPGTFVDLESLAYVFLADNQLTHVEADTLAFVSAHLSVISLSHNAIGKVDGISGLGADAEIFLDSNSLIELPEATWRPLLERGTRVWALEKFNHSKVIEI